MSGEKVSKQGGRQRWERQTSNLEVSEDLIGASTGKHVWERVSNQVVGRDRTRQTMANSASKGGVGVDNRPSLMSTCPMAALGPPRNPNNPGHKRRVKRKVGSRLHTSSHMNFPVDLESRRLGSGCGSQTSAEAHVCLHDAIWCHPSHHHIVKAQEHVCFPP